MTDYNIDIQLSDKGGRELLEAIDALPNPAPALLRLKADILEEIESNTPKPCPHGIYTARLAANGQGAELQCPLCHTPVLTRAVFDALPNKQQHTFVTDVGGLVID